MNYVLNCSDFEEQIVRTIPKAENTSKHQDNQQYGQSNIIKVVQSAIQSKRSKQYDQQYNQNNSRGNNGYITNSTYAKTRDPSKT